MYIIIGYIVIKSNSSETTEKNYKILSGLIANKEVKLENENNESFEKLEKLITKENQGILIKKLETEIFFK